MPRLTSEQIAERRLGIGSSDIPVILGISPYADSSPVALWLEKTGQWVEPEAEGDDSSAMELGHLLEPVLCAHYERQSGFIIERSGPGVESVRHPEHAWRRANLDGRIKGRSAAVECKTVGIGMARDWDLHADDGIPHYVRAQVAWQMHVADLAEVHVVGLIGGPTGFRAWIVPRDEELEQLIVSAASLFMTAVRDGIQPALDGSPQVRAWLAERYPPRPEPVVWVCEDNAVIQAGVEFCDARAARARADGEMARLGNVLIQAAGQHGADTVECEHWRATWRADKRGRTTLRVRDMRGLDVVAGGGEEWEP